MEKGNFDALVDKLDIRVILVFWDNRMVEIKFYWDPTPEQIAAATGILRQA